MENERKVTELVAGSIAEWQEKGLIPSAKIDPGYNADQPIRERKRGEFQPYAQVADTGLKITSKSEFAA
ncbi:MAG: hypothetical protein IJQ81_06940 [Oscillibacter sp.]|nr:hypothetical protein [Oscillibacter sp.]